MRAITNFIIIISTLLVLGLSLLGVESGLLKQNFYEDTCPHAEEVVRNITWERVATTSTLIPKFLRMQFHDCFVRGCDGSILLDSKENTAEKNATPNLSLAGAGSFDVINEIKSKLEEICPGVVSCADILALVTRDAVSFQFKRSIWEVKTGRRDGRVSQASEVGVNIPAPSFNFTALKQSFASKTLNVHDLVVLSGGHTIGVGHCNLFSNRLYNFTGKGDADPALDPAYAAILRTKCRSLSDNVTTVEMDSGSSSSFENTGYYNLVKAHRGLFESDAALWTDSKARALVDRLRDPNNRNMFYKEFGESMKRLCGIEVLTGVQGEIRKKCNEVN